ncbi:ion transporter [Rufibacter roseus]|uniref:Ion transporter n=1 Tax=Rufibacter roseus TaxID=1567108 RepID=A0ABW2DNX1_9BACT|nr:ion transporter [Rufibacter roseus]
MNNSKIKSKIYHIIYGTDTLAGKTFDVALIGFILLSILVVCLESVPNYRTHFLFYFLVLEWILTICFTIEYFLRIYSHPRPLRYITSFYGLIDLLSILPTYLTFFIPGLHYLMTVRIVRLLRIFRILKLTHFIQNAQALKLALQASFHKITVFILAVLSLVLIVGTVIYVVEGPENGFTSIPLSIYWTIVTITTVGYGDITPQTPSGQIISSIVMLMGYAIIAVPTGIVTVELSKTAGAHNYVDSESFNCNQCGQKLNLTANFCSNCGKRVNDLS